MTGPWDAYQPQTDTTKPWERYKAPAQPAAFESQKDFAASMDKAFGAGKWKQTSGFREPWHNYAVGGVGDSHHMLGTADAPGAHDITVDGLTAEQVEARMKAAGIRVGSYYPERDHLHVNSPTTEPQKPWLTYKSTTPAAPQPQPKSAQPIRYDQPGRPQLRPALNENPLTGGFYGRERRREAEQSYFKAVLGGGDPILSSLKAGVAALDWLSSPVSGAAEGFWVNGTKGSTPEGDADVDRRKFFGDTIASLIPIPGTGPAREGEAAVKAVAQEAERAFTTRGLNRATRKIFAPATTSTEAAKTAQTIRRARGRQQLDADRSTELLWRAQKQWGENRSPEETAAMIHHIETASQKGPRTFSRGETQPGVEQFIDLNRFAKLTHVQDAVDAISETMRYWRGRAETIIAKNVGASPEFVEDYYAHMWKQKPEEVRSALDRYYRQGSGQNFRKRTIPTIQDGIAAGLTPVSNNPFEVSARYTQNMARFLTTHDTQGWLKQAGYASWHRPGTQPEGWVKLDGILTERRPVRTGGGRPKGATGGPPEGQKGPAGPGLPGSETKRLTDQRQGAPVAGPELLEGKGGTDVALRQTPKSQGQIGGEERLRLTEGDKRNVTPGKETPRKPKGNVRPVDKEWLYAQPDAARVYNNFISKGLETNDATGGFWRGARRLGGAMTQMVLSLSGFHAFNIAHQAVISEVARGLEGASRRQWLTAARAFTKSPMAPVSYALRGDRLQKNLLRALPTDPISEKVEQAFYRSGQQIRMDDFYRSRGAGSFYQSFKRGSFKTDLRDALSKVSIGDKSLPWNKAALGRLQATGDLIANAYQTAMAPLFEVYIPKVKAGAFAENMRSWMEANPNATQDEIDRHAIKVGDTMDNRFGELVQDNLFWNRQMKQLAQIVLLAPTWKLGTYREIGGGVADISESAKGLATGKGITSRTAYIAAMAGVGATMGAIYQYMKTGQAPQSARDLMTPRTGGVTPQGAPERAQFPGYEKELEGLTLKPGGVPQGVSEEAGNAVSPLVSLGASAFTNKDWRGDPIVRPSGVDQIGGEPSRTEELAQAIADRLVPISAHARYKGTKISGPEQFMGIKAAPGYVTDPERARELRNYFGEKDIQRRLRSDARQKSEQEP